MSSELSAAINPANTSSYTRDMTTFDVTVTMGNLPYTGTVKLHGYYGPEGRAVRDGKMRHQTKGK